MTPSSPVRRLSARVLREESGVALLVVLLALVVVTLTLAAVLVANTGDSRQVRTAVAQKKAYYAATASVNAVVSALNQNPNEWLQCPSVSSALVNADNPSSDPYQEKYSYSVVPAYDNGSGSSVCVANNSNSIIDTTSGAAGAFRMLFTGSAVNGATTVKRSIVVSFYRKSLLQYIYFTNFETLDPNAVNEGACNTYHWQGRTDNNNPSGNQCYAIQFGDGDKINGPLHSNDTLDVCYSPLFGRSSTTDIVEADGMYCNSGGTPTPTIDGNATVNGSPGFSATGGATIQIPANNSQLATDAGLVITGPVDIVLGGTSASPTITYTNASGTVGPVAYPSNGVIYVQGNSLKTCTDSYTPYGSPYDDPANVGKPEYDTSDLGCGDAYVSGTYYSSLTIGSANDIVINGNLTTSTTALLGLVPNHFARVYHPITGSYYGDNGCGSGYGNGSEASGYLNNPTIDAAILAVQDSFIVDNYDCGSASNLGYLNVYGAIAQNYRGTVATSSGGTVQTGYLKNYSYNDSLATLEPPDFLNPANASWGVSRETVCSTTAASGGTPLCPSTSN